MIKSEIEWISCEERLPECKDSYLVLVEQDGDCNIDVAISFGEYIDNFWDTFIDWIEGQETHITYWAKLPSPLDIKEKLGE